jgi:hypothetical protein
MGARYLIQGNNFGDGKPLPFRLGTFAAKAKGMRSSP